MLLKNNKMSNSPVHTITSKNEVCNFTPSAPLNYILAFPIRQITVCYFSPTGGTLRVAQAIAEQLGKALQLPIKYHSYTLPSERRQLPTFANDELIIWATPTYAGRIPNKTLDVVRSAIKIKDLPCIAIVTYGNRNFDNALAELAALMRDSGGKLLGAAAVVTRHVFSETIAAQRPNAQDFQQIAAFCLQILEKLKTNNNAPFSIPGEENPAKYYTPLREDKTPANFLKAKPQHDSSRCNTCGNCLSVCPMDSIQNEMGKPIFTGICIKCQACRHICPQNAIRFTDSDFLSHIAMLEKWYSSPKSSAFFF